jgi:multicomponent Na+:H+ antiporter subunit E
MNAVITLLISIGLRLLVWGLLTADTSWPNLTLGLALAIVLPRSRQPPPSLRALSRAFLRSLAALPQAYGEALALIVHPRHRASHEVERVSGEHHPLIVFLEVFRVTLTPFTIALGMSSQGKGLRIHRLEPVPRRRQPTRAGLPGGRR